MRIVSIRALGGQKKSGRHAASAGRIGGLPKCKPLRTVHVCLRRDPQFDRERRVAKLGRDDVRAAVNPANAAITTGKKDFRI